MNLDCNINMDFTKQEKAKIQETKQLFNIQKFTKEQLECKLSKKLPDKAKREPKNDDYQIAKVFIGDSYEIKKD